MSVPKLRFNKAIAVCAALGLVWSVGACGSDAADDTQDDATSETTPIVVVASVNQWGSLAEQIGGDDVQVTSIITTTAVDAHDFEPQTSDIAALQEAEIVVSNGAGYDSWATSNLTEDTVSVSAADTVGAITGDNPHLWFSQDARISMATELAEAFSKARPDLKEEFNKRLDEWKQNEEAIEEALTAFSEKYPDATYAATEAVAYYLMSDLGFEDVTPDGYAQSTENESEPAPADLQAFQELVDSGGTDVLVNNTQQTSDSGTMILESAQEAEIPVFEVTEQMPDDVDDLTAWIVQLIDALDALFDEAYGEDDATGSDSDDADSNTSDSDSASSDSATSDSNDTTDSDMD